MRSGTGTKSGEPAVRDLLDEGDDGLLGLAVVPRGKRIGGLRNGGSKSQCEASMAARKVCIRMVFMVAVLKKKTAPGWNGCGPVSGFSVSVRAVSMAASGGFDLFLDFLQIEGARRLAGRIVLHAHEEIPGHLL